MNNYGEVFVIFQELARELRVGEKRVPAAFQVLAALNLIWEKQCGRGGANQICLAHAQPQDDPSYTCAPFVPTEPDDSRTAKTTGNYLPLLSICDINETVTYVTRCKYGG